MALSCFTASSARCTVQFFVEGGQGHGLSAPHLLFGLFQKFSFFDGQRIVRIDQSLGFDDEKPLMPFISHEIACIDEALRRSAWESRSGDVARRG